MLQRGRGGGVFAVLADPTMADLVIDCVIHDPRWDHQCEERDLYLTRLILALDLPLGAIGDHLLDPVTWADPSGWRSSLACDVLLMLARAEHPTACRLLRDYLASAHGSQWRDMIDLAWESRIPQLRQDLHQLVLPRLTDEDVHHLAEPSYGPWQAWRTADPRVDHALRATSPTTAARPSAPFLGSADVDELTQLVAAQPVDHRLRIAAWRELGHRRELLLLDLAEQPTVRNQFGRIPGLRHALAALGPTAVLRARVWIDAEDEALTDAAVDVLAEHGDETDSPALLRTFQRACTDDHWYLAEDCARGLGRLHVASAVEPLREAWEHTIHSHARASFLTALLAIDPDGADNYTAEGLHDAEPEVRIIAINTCAATQTNRSTITATRDDPIEDEDVRRNARQRLG